MKGSIDVKGGMVDVTLEHHFDGGATVLNRVWQKKLAIAYQVA